MSLTRKVAHNTVIQIGGKILSTALGLLAIGMMTRYLGQEQFGWYVTAISYLQFIGILIDFGLIPVTAQMMSAPAYDKTHLFRNLLGYRFATAILFLGIAPLIALFFPYPIQVKIAIAFSTLSFLGIAMNQVLIGFYQTKLKMHIPVIGEVAGRIAFLVALFFFIRGNAGFLYIMGAVALGSLIYTLVLWVAAHRETSVSFAFDRDVWIAITKKMWPIAISIIFNVVYLKGDIVILSLVRSQSEVGIYGAAYRVLDIVAQLAMMMMGVMLPLLAYAWTRNDRDSFRLHYQRSFDIMMLFALPMMLGIMLLAEPIMTLVAGEEFAGAGVMLQILSIAVFGVYLGAVFGHAAVAIDKQKQTMWIYISDAILTLIGYLIFIPRFGLAGAAWMTVFSELYAGILLAWSVRSHTQEKLRFVTLYKIVLASAVMAITLFFLSPLHVLLLIPIGIIAYGGTLLAVGGISKETIREILSVKKDTI